MNDSEILECLLDSDGSTRDITFDPIEFKDIGRFLDTLLVDYDVEIAYDNESNDITDRFVNKDTDLFVDEFGYGYAYLQTESNPIRTIQLFIDEIDGNWIVEISFFPKNVVAKDLNVSDFIALVEKWARSACAKGYYVRYENASWKLFDENDLGVFLHKEISY